MAEALKAAVLTAAYVAPLETFTLWIQVAANLSCLLDFREEERQILQMLGLITSTLGVRYSYPQGVGNTSEAAGVQKDRPLESPRL